MEETGCEIICYGIDDDDGDDDDDDDDDDVDISCNQKRQITNI